MLERDLLKSNAGRQIIDEGLRLCQDLGMDALGRRILSPALARPGRGPVQRARVAGLTRRELEVLRLVAQGRTNRDIAETLVLSETTVARHLTNIFTKIGVENRARAMAFAPRSGLTVADPTMRRRCRSLS
ncbi:MAG: LuxR C-terminal-related transcriptional regulator [Ardenticatenaceae bacterium]|nr:LuxR C-terminal-related transcriptional regulator [Ardenticatenaceae bacterium]HBY98539.1 hypothetical protein [Chloroflexota bacterium]